MSADAFAVGAIWYSVDGSPIDESADAGVELEWTSFRVDKLTPRGAWLHCIEWSYRKPRFALRGGVRWCSPTKAEALHGLVQRKRRQIRILEAQLEFSKQTLEAATAALRAAQ